MAWSPNRSSDKGPVIPPFVPPPSHLPLKGMVVASGLFHLFLGILALYVSSLHATSIRLEPVAVVDLIGGGEFRPPAEKPQAKPAAPAPAPPAPKAEPVPKAPAVREKPPAKPPAKKRAPAVAAPDEFSLAKKRAAANLSSLEERLRRMREARSDSDVVRKAVEEHRREAAARAAVRRVGERVARRIETPPASAVSGSGPGGTGGGSKGSVRVAPELLEYFRKLEERVRGAWVLPGSVVRDAGKLMVEMRIVIEKDGRVSDTRIEKGSGNAYFDESVQRAIRKASPLPVPPEGLRGGEDYYEVGFRFHGTGGGG